jgi:hypothetical protein
LQRKWIVISEYRLPVSTWLDDTKPGAADAVVDRITSAAAHRRRTATVAQVLEVAI